MPAWVIVANSADGSPLVLTEWLFGPVWSDVAAAKALNPPPRLFRDRWRAKRQARQLPRSLTPRCVRYGRL